MVASSENHFLVEAVQAILASDPERAFRALAEVLRKNPRFPNAHLVLGLALYARKEEKVALDSIKEEVLIHSNNDLARQILSSGWSVAPQILSALIPLLTVEKKSSPSSEQTPSPHTHGASRESSLASRFPGVSFGTGVQIIGLANTSIEAGTCVGDNSWINVCVRDHSVRIRIGERVLIGRGSMISTGGHLELGSFCVLAPRVYISDADHGFSDISLPVLQQEPTLGRTTTIEENCWFGIGTVVTGGVTVGRGSILGANAVLTKDLPPFAVAVGVPAVIVKMYNPETRLWEAANTIADQERIIQARSRVPLPDRAEYRQILARKASFGAIDPVLAGREQHL